MQCAFRPGGWLESRLRTSCRVTSGPSLRIRVEGWGIQERLHAPFCRHHSRRVAQGHDRQHSRTVAYGRACLRTSAQLDTVGKGEPSLGSGPPHDSLAQGRARRRTNAQLDKVGKCESHLRTRAGRAAGLTLGRESGPRAGSPQDLRSPLCRGGSERRCEGNGKHEKSKVRVGFRRTLVGDSILARVNLPNPTPPLSLLL